MKFFRGQLVSDKKLGIWINLYQYSAVAKFYRCSHCVTNFVRCCDLAKL